MGLIGWGDESGSDSARDPGTYLLSVVLVEANVVDQVRAAMEQLRYKGHKLHWRDETAKRREQIAQTMATLPVTGLVVVRCNAELADAQERRRRKCLEPLLPLLTERGCAQLTLESRGRSDDERDMEMLQTMRTRRLLAHGLHLDHVPGPQDPALWAADALCGAVVCERVNDPGNYLDTLRAGIHVQMETI